MSNFCSTWKIQVFQHNLKLLRADLANARVKPGSNINLIY